MHSIVRVSSETVSCNGLATFVFVFALIPGGTWSYEEALDAEEDVCDSVHISTETIHVSTSAGKLVEIHVRLNTQGDIEIEDEDRGRNRVEFEVVRIGSSEMEASRITINHTLIDIGSGNSFLLQVDYAKRVKSRISVLVGLAICGAICLSLLSIIFWFIYKRRQHQHFGSQIPAEGISIRSNPAGEYVKPAGINTQSGDLSRPLTTDALKLRPSEFCNPLSLDPDGRMATTCSTSSYTAPRVHPVAVNHGTSIKESNRFCALTMSIICVTSVVLAICPSEPRARIILHLSPSVKLNVVKLFFNRAHQNDVLNHRWSNKNGTQLELYDLEAASPTGNLPCLAKSVCPYAYIQNLAGCDAATGRCVCQRGYEFDHGVCIDIDECMDRNHHCPAMATCQNTIGSYGCQCGYGFFGDDQGCRGCSVGCPPGSFESVPCNNNGDRVCSECSQCEGSTFEVRPCSATSDRQCMHVAHPLLITGGVSTTAFLKEMKVDASPNIFLEDLHSIRNLETLYYVTDMTQASDFIWDRESGLRVNVGILNIHLIPKYEDVAHESDNKYMLNYPNNSEDKLKFQNVVRNYCRNPIPDYYSITLEISRDRTTAAEQVICDSKDLRKPPCPPWYKDGDTFLHRTLNDACQKMGTFPEPLQPAANSIVCTDSSALLREVFNHTYSTERPITFPPNKCRSAKSRCDQCLNQPRCLALDIFERKCCQVECFTLMDCKQMVSEECTKVTVECAMGDAYRYTIQPIFQNIKTEFQCHVQHMRFDVLYELFYFIQIPGIGFQTPKVYKTVYARDLAYQSRGEFKADFLTVEHNTGLNLKDEFILVGRETSSKMFNYTVHSLKMEDEYRKKKVVIHEISHNIFVASTQFERPFDYSTSSWVRDNDCNKNVSKLKIVQKHYGTDYQDVNIFTQNNGDRFTYFVKSVENAPYLRFIIPGNKSILPYYFRDNGPRLLTNESLRAELSLTSQGRIWEIYISGRMSGCPGYLGVTINSRLDLEELFRYELLILCPAEFNLTFKIPNWGQHPDKTFDIQLQDSTRSYTLYLTQLIFDQMHLETEPEAMNTIGSPTVPLTVLMAFGSVVAVLLVAFSVAYIYKEIKKARFLNANQTSFADPIATMIAMDSPRSKARPNRSHAQSQPKIIAGMYFAFWAVYSLGFTFTMFFAVLSLLTREDAIRVAEVGTFQADMQNASAAAAETIKHYRVNELVRQAQAVTRMQKACSHYVGQLFTGLAFWIEKVIGGQHLKQVYGPQTSIGRLVADRNNQRLAAYVHQLGRFTDEYRANVTANIAYAITMYRKYLQSVLYSNWFSFPQQLFNSSDFERPLAMKGDDRHALLGYEADFGAFLEIEEVEEMQLWPRKFWERYSNRLPESPNMTVPMVNRTHPQCLVDGSRSIPNISRLVQLDRLDSFHFFSNHLSTEPIHPGGGVISSESITGAMGDQYYHPQHVPPELEEPLWSSDLHDLRLFNEINADVLRIVFLVLDALLITYRFTSMYANGITIWKHFSSTVSTNFEVFPGPDGNILSEASVARMHLRREQRPPDFNSMPGGFLSQCNTYVEADYHHPFDTNDLIHGCTGPRGAMEETQNEVSEIVLPPTPSAESNADTIKAIVTQILKSSALVKLIIMCVLLLGCYVIINSSVLFLDVRVFTGFDCFGMYINAIRVQVNQSNWYLTDEARYFNGATMGYYRTQMESELASLQGLLEYFNSEQKRLVTNYVAEACAIHQLPQVNWSCDINIELPHLEFPILPCNFMPVQPFLYAGFRSGEYETQLNVALTLYLTSVKNIITRTLYVLLAIATTVLAVHITASILHYHLNLLCSTSQSNALVCEDVNAHTELLDSVSPSVVLNTERREAAGGSVGDRDNGQGVVTASSIKNSSTLLTDFKYSETNV